MGRLTKASVVGLIALLLNVACGHNNTSYSYLPVTQNFKQATLNSQIDVLWVVDNSGSMQPLQQNMTNNFNSFIQDFVSKGYDFHLAVTSTEAYLAGSQFHNDPNYAIYSNGVSPNLTGVFDILSTTTNLINTFITNASLGANGSGDERAFSSMKAALTSTASQNSNFLRPKSYFAIIILSDEDDFSDPNRPEYSWAINGGIPDHDYADPGLETTDSYVSFLNTLTGTSGASARYSVNAITVLDSACQQAHVAASSSTIIGQRYIELANKTNGVLGSICDSSYATAMANIKNNIMELGTQFYLDSVPVVSSIVVIVNGVSIPQDATNGWTYNSTANSIVFHGTAVPAAAASVNIGFDPAKLTF